jgi:hypothetical protein
MNAARGVHAAIAVRIPAGLRDPDAVAGHATEL